MPIAIDPRAPFDYILECDRKLPKEEQTVFKLKVLTVREMAELQDTLLSMEAGTNDLSVRAGSHSVKVLQVGLIGWSNFNDAQGNPVPFEKKNWGRAKGPKEVVTDDCLDRLHPDWRAELANAITEQARLSEEDRKNS